ncbi:MAG: sigma-54 dependent transcriptional regulator [Pseudomonadota bacterium]|uniref:Sigma-54-dependent Fis family transcriptional regulator n=1 Tax=Candidatus Desulfatibia profunda TaxID=2841695 RepID=A0A8J6TM73_9BACT|nr:sigma-54-dependent Fis family transcriptional regulator [Candidatus Desulfatibia profunda]MBL7195976.1 sigma-54-dependent Fis family transcriptional regulator [Desulfobacterales bacterium]
MRKKKLLLVDNNTNDNANHIYKFFTESGFDVITTDNGRTAFEEVVGDHYDLVITELNLPQIDGLGLLKRIKDIKESLPVILISDNAGVKEAVAAMKLGANDFLIKPLSLKMIEMITSRVSNGLELGEKEKPNGKFRIITKNKEMKHLLQMAREVADSRASIFIQGESGTGKELFARYIHHYSTRRQNTFIAINCAALPETLLESELFGHEKGAFTGAISRKKGKFELANQGTLLLDEISEMDYQLQSKLLRVLQEREIDRIGGMDPVPVDVRFIATTNRNIEEQIAQGKFREDLYYRVNVIPFRLPPLRERIDDIPLLADYFIEKYCKIDKRSVKGLTAEAMASLMQLPWKGNVREFENMIERAVLMCRGDLIDEKTLFTISGSRPTENSGYRFMPALSLKEMERSVIFRALDQTDGNRTHAAEMLGISVRTLRNKLNEYKQKMATS